MIGFIQLTRSEGENVRPELINVEAIDVLAPIQGGLTYLRLRSGYGFYISETLEQVTGLLDQVNQ